MDVVLRSAEINEAAVSEDPTRDPVASPGKNHTNLRKLYEYLSGIYGQIIKIIGVVHEYNVSPCFKIVFNDFKSEFPITAPF